MSANIDAPTTQSPAFCEAGPDSRPIHFGRTVMDSNACFRVEVQSVLKLRIEGSLYRRNRGSFVDAPSHKRKSDRVPYPVRKCAIPCDHVRYESPTGPESGLS